MTSSKQMVCSSECKEFGMQARGARQRQSYENVSSRTVVSVSTTPPMQKKSIIDAGPIVPLNPWPSQRKKNADQNHTINETRGEKMHAEPNGHDRTERGSLPISERPTTEKEPSGLQKYSKVETGETLPESSDEHSNAIAVASSDILSLSKQSAERLFRLMKATVTDEDLDVDRSSKTKEQLSLQRVQVAIQAANAITGIVQANVNLVKAMNKQS
jgi:hypothetical protein